MLVANLDAVWHQFWSFDHFAGLLLPPFRVLSFILSTSVVVVVDLEITLRSMVSPTPKSVFCDCPRDVTRHLLFVSSNCFTKGLTYHPFLT
jgi:hypothetical protein